MFFSLQRSYTALWVTTYSKRKYIIATRVGEVDKRCPMKGAHSRGLEIYLQCSSERSGAKSISLVRATHSDLLNVRGVQNDGSTG